MPISTFFINKFRDFVEKKIEDKNIKDDEEILLLDKETYPQLSSILELGNIDNSVKYKNHLIMNSATIPLDSRKDKDKSDTDDNRKDKDKSDTDDNGANIYNHYKQEQEQEQKHGYLHGFNNDNKNMNSHVDKDDLAGKTRENVIPTFSNHPHPHPHPHPNLHSHPRRGMFIAAADDIINHQQHSSSVDNGLIAKNTMTQTDTDTHTQTQSQSQSQTQTQTDTKTQSHTHTRTEIKKEKERATLELFASQSPSEFIITSQDESPYPTDIKAYTGKLRLYAISYGKRKGGFFSLLFLFLVGK